jgi:hypothetical protein
MQATTDVVVWYGLVSVGVSLLVVKILSCSYFLHSIALSVALGWLGTTVAARCCAAMLPHDKSLHTASTAGTRLATAFFGLLALAAFVAHRVEQNEAPIMRVPKRECACRVLCSVPLPRTLFPANQPPTHPSLTLLAAARFTRDRTLPSSLERAHVHWSLRRISLIVAWMRVCMCACAVVRVIDLVQSGPPP